MFIVDMYEYLKCGSSYFISFNFFYIWLAGLIESNDNLVGMRSYEKRLFLCV